MSEHPGKPTAHDFYRLDADAYSAAEAAFKPDPTQASAARLTAIEVTERLMLARGELAKATVFYRLAAVRGADNDELRTLACRLDECTREVEYAIAEPLLAQIDTLRQDLATEQQARLTEVEQWVNNYNGVEKWRVRLSVDNAALRQEQARLEAELVDVRSQVTDWTTEAARLTMERDNARIERNAIIGQDGARVIRLEQAEQQRDAALAALKEVRRYADESFNELNAGAVMALCDAALHPDTGRTTEGVSYARKKDRTHQAVLEALHIYGWTVMDCSRAPLCIDLVIAKHGRVVLVEVKDRVGKLTEGQKRLLSSWPGEVAVLRSLEDVARLTADDRTVTGSAIGNWIQARDRT